MNTHPAARDAEVFCNQAYELGIGGPIDGGRLEISPPGAIRLWLKLAPFRPRLHPYL